MYEFIGIDGPRQQYAELVRSREQERLERQVVRAARRSRVRPGRLTWGFLRRRQAGAIPMVGRVVGV